jgi:hypothetical protein
MTINEENSPKNISPQISLPQTILRIVIYWKSNAGKLIEKKTTQNNSPE